MDMNKLRLTVVRSPTKTISHYGCPLEITWTSLNKLKWDWSYRVNSQSSHGTDSWVEHQKNVSIESHRSKWQHFEHPAWISCQVPAPKSGLSKSEFSGRKRSHVVKSQPWKQQTNLGILTGSLPDPYHLDPPGDPNSTGNPSTWQVRHHTEVMGFANGLAYSACCSRHYLGAEPWEWQDSKGKLGLDHLDHLDRMISTWTSLWLIMTPKYF